MDGKPSTRGNKNFPLTNSQSCVIIRVSKARGSRQDFEKFQNAAFVHNNKQMDGDKKYFEKFLKKVLTKSRTYDIIKAS